jgi:cysteine-rich repeat protein
MEQCDDGNDLDTDDCTTACFDAACGDGFLQPGEGCDDGNLNDGDGCTGMCVTEQQLQKIVFVSSQLYDANLGGLAGADAKCQALADAASLPGTYLAWLSTDEVNGTPATRFTQSAMPYRTVTGVTIADNWADLIDSTLDSQLNVTELGGPAPVGNNGCGGGNFPTVWSATSFNGTLANASYTCTNWTSTVSNFGSIWGLATDTANGWWSYWCSGGLCGWTSALYCFQQ